MAVGDLDHGVDVLREALLDGGDTGIAHIAHTDRESSRGERVRLTHGERPSRGALAPGSSSTNRPVAVVPVIPESTGEMRSLARGENHAKALPRPARSHL